MTYESVKGTAKSVTSNILMKHTKGNKGKTLILLKKLLLKLEVRASFWALE